MTIASGSLASAADILRHANASGYLQLDDLTAATIATGAITVTKNWYSVDTEGAAASDDLDTITAGSGVADGHLLLVRAANSSRTVVIRHGTGNVYNVASQSVILDDATDCAAYVYDGGNSRWVQFGGVPFVPDDSTVELGGGALRVKDAGVTSAKLARPISVRVTNSGAVSIPNNSPTNLTFDTETFDTDGMHSTSVNTDRLTVATAGTYLFTASIELGSTSTTGVLLVVMSLNGLTTIASAQVGNTSLGAFVCVIGVYQMSVSDYVKLSVYQDNGGARNVTTQSSFSAVRLGA